MTIIDIENCENVTGAGLSKLDGRNVTELSCKESRFNDEDLNSLANFPKLQGLNLSSTRITNKGLAMLLLKAPDLHSLVINSCPSITDDAFAALVKMPHLQALDLRQDAIGAKGISWLGKSKLVHIKISGTNVTDEDLKVIGQNKNLRELFLDGCHHITGTGFKYLTSLPLKFLDIGDCKLSPGTLSAFRRAEPNCRLLYTREKFVGGQVVGVMDLFKP
jgi:hypothetical protein